MLEIFGANFSEYSRRYFRNEKICKIKCPVCHKPTKTVLKYAKSNTEKYISLVKCKEHGKFIVKLRIKKIENTGYKVSVSGISDVFGNTLDEPINHTFTTGKRIVSVGKPVFTNAWGDELSNIEPGEITASFDVYRNDKVEMDILALAAVYNKSTNELVSCNAVQKKTCDDNFALTVNVPDDGEEYYAVSYTWDNYSSLNPYNQLTVLEGNK